MNKDDLINSIHRKIVKASNEAKHYAKCEVLEPEQHAWVEMRNFYEGRASAYKNALAMIKELS